MANIACKNCFLFFVSCWNKEKLQTETCCSKEYKSFCTTDQAAPDQLTIPTNKLPCSGVSSDSDISSEDERYILTSLFLFGIDVRHFGQVFVPVFSHFWIHSLWIKWPHCVETTFFSDLNDSKHIGHFMFWDAKLVFHCLIGSRLILLSNLPVFGIIAQQKVGRVMIGWCRKIPSSLSRNLFPPLVHMWLKRVQHM